MPLLDHFHAPLQGSRHWESFHARWASAISDALNVVLPDDYFAESQVHSGRAIEIDVAGFRENSPSAGGTAVAVARPAVLSSPPDVVMPAIFPPSFGVHVFETVGGPVLVAAVELVSPGNKDRPEARSAFTSKCVSYITAGVGLVVVDVVTARHSRPFAELIAALWPGGPIPEAGPLTAASYRPIRDGGGDSLEVRVRALELGGVLPELPLALGGFGQVVLDLEATYEEARSRSRLG